jgi:ABC-2 family transporter protein
MTWLAWRQFRSNMTVALVGLVVGVTALVVSADHVKLVYRNGSNELTGMYVWVRLLGTVLIGVPAVIGAFWGAPLVASEIEAHTHRLAWTQTVTRRRWLASKFALPGFATMIFVGGFSAVFTRWSGPIDATGNRTGTANFAQRGIVPIGYALFALALGTLLGTLQRRTLPAMASTIAVFFVARLVVQKLVRPRLFMSAHVRMPTFGSTSYRGWVLESRTVDAAGRTLNGVESQLISACNITRAAPDPNAALAACARKLGIHDIARVHPDSHFWALQILETGIFVGLAAIALTIAFRSVQTRT